MSQGENMSFYLPKDKLWLKNSIRAVQLRAEERGVPLSVSQIIVWALEEALNKGDHPESKPLKKDFAYEDKLKRRVVCRTKDRWLLRFIDNIVKTKRETGIRTSFSYELFRLAKNGLLKSLRKDEIDEVSRASAVKVKE